MIAILTTAAASAQDRVTVCISAPGDLREYKIQSHRTMAIVSQAYAAIGIAMDWRTSRRQCAQSAARTVSITLRAETPRHVAPSVLAVALPYEGSHVEIFYSRVQDSIAPPHVPVLLAHVFIHEIAHILQGIKRHSAEGIMKARWDSTDHQKMLWEPLPFSEYDVKLIRDGLVRGQSPALVRR
jgi:hypothetical protein